MTEDIKHFHRLLDRKHAEMVANLTVETANALFDTANAIDQVVFFTDRKLSGRCESMMWTAIRLGAAR